MSTINIIVIGRDKIRRTQIHYREAMQKISRDISGLKHAKAARDEFLDAGYILIDFNIKTIVSSQNAFSFSSIEEKAGDKMKGWRMIDLMVG